MRRKTRYTLAKRFQTEIEKNLAKPAIVSLEKIVKAAGPQWRDCHGAYNERTSTSGLRSYHFGVPRSGPEAVGAIVFLFEEHPPFPYRIARITAPRTAIHSATLDEVENPLIYDQINSEWMAYDADEPEKLIDPKDALLEWLADQIKDEAGTSAFAQFAGV